MGQPVNSVITRALALLAADTVTFNPGTANKVILFTNPLTLSPETVFADLVVANFQGYAALDIADGPQPTSVDSNTGNRIMDLPAADGIWRWETTGTSSLPQTIYGWAITTDADVLLYAERLAQSVTLSGLDESIMLARPAITLGATGIF